MKRKLFLCVMLLSLVAANAQIVRWVIPPLYDKIYMAPGAQLIITDSLTTSILWSLDGQRLAVTSDHIHAFKEGKAVTTKRGTDIITGFYTVEGKFVSLESCKVANSYPYFSGGFLLVRDNSSSLVRENPYLLAKDGCYCFLDAEGRKTNYGSYVKAFPFLKGYSACFTYESIEKQKNPYYIYKTIDDEAISFSYHNKYFDTDDVEFISSLNEEGIGIVVIKHKVYYFDGASKTLKPVFAKEDEVILKNQIYTKGHVSEYLQTVNDSLTILKAKNGKTEEVEFRFDKLCIPTSINFAQRVVNFKRTKEVIPSYKTILDVEMSWDKKQAGLNYNGKALLPPQFDTVDLRFNNNAFVCSSGKWGMIMLDNGENVSLRMNKGNDIAFRHQKFETTIRLDLPTVMSSHKTRIDIAPESGCLIDKTSYETRDTENGNYVQYNCVLTIPESLPDVITDLEYPVQISFDGLKYPIIPLAVKAWHYKYFNVDINETETTIEQGTVSFTINLNAEKTPGEDDYPFEVAIKTDSLQTELEKISETRYKCKLSPLNEGVNNFSIHILEKGCPPSVFPFEVTYVKPVPRSRKKEQVVIQKKEKTQVKVAPPHLEI